MVGCKCWVLGRGVPGTTKTSSSALASSGSGCAAAYRSSATTLAYCVQVVAPGELAASGAAPARPRRSGTGTTSTSERLASGCASPMTKRTRTHADEASAPTHVQRRSRRRPASPEMMPSSSVGVEGGRIGSGCTPVVDQLPGPAHFDLPSRSNSSCWSLRNAAESAPTPTHLARRSNCVLWRVGQVLLARAGADRKLEGSTCRFDGEHSR